jgi:undecaprenyl-diphosphatase
MFELNEVGLFRLINNLSGQVPAVDRVMITLSDSNTWFLCSAIFFIVAFRTKNTKLLEALICAAISLGVSDLVSFEVVKPIVARDRPCWVVLNTKTILGHCGGSYGFTSNHASNAFAVWWVVATYYGRNSRASLLVLWIATSVAISRVYLGVHYVGDVVGGAILGVLVASSLNALGLMRLVQFAAAKILRDKI